MNEHKFYNEYILPVLEEIKEEFNKRGVDTFMDGNELLIGGGGKGMSVLTYNYAFAEFNVHEDYHNFFENEFNAINCTTELVFKPIKPKSIYDLEIGDEFYYIDYLGYKWIVRKCLIQSDGDYECYKRHVEQDEAFLTQEECEKRIAKNQAIAKIKKRAYELQGDWKPKWSRGDFKYSLYYDFNYKIIDVDRNEFYSCGQIFFKTKEIGEQIIGELFEECKIMLEVE